MQRIKCNSIGYLQYTLPLWGVLRPKYPRPWRERKGDRSVGDGYARRRYVGGERVGAGGDGRRRMKASWATSACTRAGGARSGERAWVPPPPLARSSPPHPPLVGGVVLLPPVGTLPRRRRHPPPVGTVPPPGSAVLLPFSPPTPVGEHVLRPANLFWS